MAKYLDDSLDEAEAKLEASRSDEIKALEQAIEHEKKQQWRTDAQALISEAKKENVKLQLEAAYRERLQRVYTEVKKRRFKNSKSFVIQLQNSISLMFHSVN